MKNFFYFLFQFKTYLNGYIIILYMYFKNNTHIYINIFIYLIKYI